MEQTINSSGLTVTIGYCTAAERQSSSNKKESRTVRADWRLNCAKEVPFPLQNSRVAGFEKLKCPCSVQAPKGQVHAFLDVVPIIDLRFITHALTADTRSSWSRRHHAHRSCCLSTETTPAVALTRPFWQLMSRWRFEKPPTTGPFCPWIWCL